MEDDEKEDENERVEQVESDPLCSRSALDEEARQMIIYQLQLQKGNLASMIDLNKLKSIQPFNEKDYTSTRISLNIPQSIEVKTQQKLLQSPSEKWTKIIKSVKLFKSSPPQPQLKTSPIKTYKLKDKDVITSRTKTKIRLKPKRKKDTPIDLTTVRIGFIGAGKMTEAIIKGLLNGITTKQLFVSSKSGKNHLQFRIKNISTTKRSYDIFGQLKCNLVFLAIHGSVIRSLIQANGIVKPLLTGKYIPKQPNTVFILSLIGGVNLDQVKQTLINPNRPERYRLELYRIMLNYCCAYGKGIGVINVIPELKSCNRLVLDVLNLIAQFEYITESEIDSFCAVGGYGLALNYYFLENLIKAAKEKLGLDPALATRLFALTFKMAADSVIATGKSAADLMNDYLKISNGFFIKTLNSVECSDKIISAIETSYQRIKY